MRILVCGSRDYTDSLRLSSVLDGYAAIYQVEAVIEGCARGADRLAEGWAVGHGIPVEHYPADWARLGRGGGHIRNRQMIEARPDLVVAFYRNRAWPSPGTTNLIRQAQDAEIEVVIV